MARQVDPISTTTAVAEKDSGRATSFFVRQWNNLLALVRDVSDTAAAALAAQATADAVTARTITAGVALDGGGTLNANITIDHGSQAGDVGVFGDTTHYPIITVDTQGHVTNVDSQLISSGVGGVAALTNTHIFVGNATNVAVDVAMSGDVTISNAGVTALANTAVTPGTYGDASHIPTVTVDAKGRITAASHTAIATGTASSLSTEILADTPTAYWKCDDASGNIVDYGGGGFHLSSITNISYQHSPLLPAESTKYIRFTNTNACAKLTSGLGLTYPLSGDMTTMCIVMQGSIGGAAWFGIDGGSSELEINNSQVEIRLAAATQTPGARHENSTGTENTANAPYATMKAGEVYILHFVRDATAKTVSIYINGRLQEAGVSYSNNPTGGTGTMVTYIGATGETTTNTTIVIGHVALYNGVKLSAARIFAHAKAAGLTGSN